ncbi:MAG: hypothetical protein KF885_05630 [Anaerolineales bacterium]|nr:hypothetical protein [Anaerolineales bacterium]
MTTSQLGISSQHEDTHPEGEAQTGFNICPFLGMEDDPQTSFLFTSPGNFCHRLKPPKAVSIGYQGATCFDSKAFVKCPIYQKKWDGTLPEGFRHRNGNNSSQQPLTPPRWVILLLLLSLILLGISAYMSLL